MDADLPGAVPEIPVSDIDAALEYYGSRFGFNLDWAVKLKASPVSLTGTAGCS